ncbi:hypothetical protein C5E18_24235 (plasmid) [Pectobacterium parmentieri]|nr:hypothetical protein C5E18_24235 [Pectobacterium parmentieri]
MLTDDESNAVVLYQSTVDNTMVLSTSMPNSNNLQTMYEADRKINAATLPPVNPVRGQLLRQMLLLNSIKRIDTEISMCASSQHYRLKIAYVQLGLERF